MIFYTFGKITDVRYWKIGKINILNKHTFVKQIQHNYWPGYIFEVEKTSPKREAIVPIEYWHYL